MGAGDQSEKPPVGDCSDSLLVSAGARHVVLEPWTPRWREAFEEDVGLLRQLLGPVLVRAHHIGSTSVEGLLAKPIVDVVGEVTSLADLDARRDAFEQRGMDWRGEYGIPRRRLVVRPPEAGWASNRAHLHLFAAGDPEVHRHLVFRDALRASPETRDAYAALKTTLAARFPDDRTAYTDAKSAFIADLVARSDATAP